MQVKNKSLYRTCMLCTILLVNICLACKKEKLAMDAYRAFVLSKDYSCQTTQSLVAADYSIKWLPPFYSYLASNEALNAKACQHINKLNQNQRPEVLEFLFEIKIKNQKQSLSNLNNLEKNTVAVDYLSAQISRDLQMITESNDTLPCLSSQLERHYSIDDKTTLLLHFSSKKDWGKSLTILFNDRLFNQGIIKFNFLSKDYSQLPKLETKNICN
jgi:hypothetical protein